jgi:outer membrane protein assembly factor BamB
MPDPPWGLAADPGGAVTIGQDGGVRAVDRRGRTLWDSSIADPTIGDPAIGGDTVLVGTMTSVAALDRATGTTRWTQPMAGEVTSVTVASGWALAGDHLGNLRAFDPATGMLRWSVTFPGALVVAPRVDRDARFVVATWHWSYTPAIRTLDLATGNLRWESPIGQFTAAAVVAGDVLVVAEGDGDFHARARGLDLATGAERWAETMPGSFESAIEGSHDGGRVAVVDHFGNLAMLEAGTGRVLWRAQLGGGVVRAKILFVGARVVSWTFGARLVVLHARTGRLVSTTSETQMGGSIISAAVAPWSIRPAVVVALRLGNPHSVELRRVP